MNPLTYKRFSYGDTIEDRVFCGWRRRDDSYSPVFMSTRAFQNRSSTKSQYRKGKTRTESFIINNLYQGAKTRALKRRLPFSLSKDWIRLHLQRALREGEVVLASKGTGERCARAPSIDRILPQMGYEEHNCRIVPVQLNCAKGEWDDDTFLEVVGAEVDRLRAQRALCAHV